MCNYITCHRKIVIKVKPEKKLKEMIHRQNSGENATIKWKQEAREEIEIVPTEYEARDLHWKQQVQF